MYKRQGIACVAGGIFFLTLSDANAKWLGTTYNPLQILFLRALIALPFVTALAVWLGGRRVLRTAHPGLHLTRGAINVVSACCFYLGPVSYTHLVRWADTPSVRGPVRMGELLALPRD